MLSHQVEKFFECLWIFLFHSQTMNAKDTGQSILYFKTTALNGGVFSFFIYLENVLFFEEVTILHNKTVFKVSLDTVAA